MRVLVTGGAGYIGCLVVQELLRKNHVPVVFDAFYWGKESLKTVTDRIEIIEEINSFLRTKNDYELI